MRANCSTAYPWRNDAPPASEIGTFPQNTPPYCCYYYTFLSLLGTTTTLDDRWKMKFTCNTKDIASAVGAASKVVNAHTTVPILSNVLLASRGRKDRGRAAPISS